MSSSQSHIHHDIDKLKSAGQRLTPQRRLVLEVMQQTHGHVSVEYVMSQASKHDPEVNLATVYRILGWLTEHRIICVTDMGERDLAYEYLGNPRHHHLVCQECGEQTEVPFDLVTPLVNEIRSRFGFHARIDHQAIFGSCQKCQRSNTSSNLTNAESD